MPPKNTTTTSAASKGKTKGKVQTKSKATSGKKVAGKKAKVEDKKKKQKVVDKIAFPAKPRSFGIGQDIQPKRNLGRFVKWPKYVRLQRQRQVLVKRLKVPPSVNQFTETVNKATATQLFKLLQKYRPEDKAQKKDRLRKLAAEKATKDKATVGEKPVVLKFGLNHVTALIEQRKARLVVIAHDVDPIEAFAISATRVLIGGHFVLRCRSCFVKQSVLLLYSVHSLTLDELANNQSVFGYVHATSPRPLLVVFIPALCRKLDVPYCIVKSKARLGRLVHHKTATCLALTSVKKADEVALNTLIDTLNNNYKDRFDEIRKTWGGQKMGMKTNHKLAEMARKRAREAAALLH
eukprot:gene5404-7141_t